MSMFHDFVHVCGFVEISNYGLDFAWSNARSKSKLDKFFVSPSWVQLYEMPEAFHLPKVTSNHCAIRITCGRNNFGKAKMFRFELVWCRVSNFKDMLRKW